MILAPGSSLDRFVVVRLLRDGALARVYLVKHRRTGSEHAIKLFRLTTERARQRFLQEGKVQARIRHPNIVAVTDVVDGNEQVGLVMEYVDGPTLAEVITGDEAISRQDIPDLFDQICRGVAAAHGEGALHGNLKPANVLIAVQGRRVQARIKDFGIAKVFAEFFDRTAPLTESGTLMGTLGYLSPEQLNNPKSADARSDVFALGCMLYEMLGGKPPYLRRDPASTIAATHSGEHRPLVEWVAGMPHSLNATIEQAIHPEPGNRFDSVEFFRLAIADGFEAFPSTQPPTHPTPPPSRGEQTPPPLDAPPGLAPAFPLERTDDATDDVPHGARQVASNAAISEVEIAGPTVVPETAPVGHGREATVSQRGRALGGSWLGLFGATVAIGAGFLGWTTDEHAALLAKDIVAVSSLAQSLPRAWSDLDPRLSTAITAGLTPELSALADTFTNATTVETRVAGGRELVRAVRANLATRATTGGENANDLQVATAALKPIETKVSEAESVLASATYAADNWKSSLASALGWINLETPIAQQTIAPAPRLEVFRPPLQISEPEPIKKSNRSKYIRDGGRTFTLGGKSTTE